MGNGLMERFDWHNSNSEIKGLRTHNTKDFPHPTDPTKRIRIEGMKIYHAFTGEKFEDIDRELPNYNFPEGMELSSAAEKHFVLDLPEWGEVKHEGDVVRVYDKKGVSVFIYKDLFVLGKDKKPFEEKEFGAKERHKDAEPAEWVVEGKKLYIKVPSLGKNQYPIRVYDATDTASTNNKNAHVYSGIPDTNYGGLAYLFVGMSSGYVYRTYIHFTLSSGSGTVTTVKLYLYDRSSPAGHTVNAHALTQTGWVENQVTWNSYKTGSAWATAGGDFSATIIDSVVCSNLAWINWVLMGTGSDNPLTLDWGDEVHILLKKAAETGTYSEQFDSKEYAGTSTDPYVEITYTPAPLTISVSDCVEAKFDGLV